MFIKGSSGISAHPKLHTYQEGYILPVLSAEDLFFSARHKGILRQFHDSSGLSDELYDQLYTQLIYRFMEFVQVLPHKPNGILGSLLNYGLARASVVLQKYLQKRKLQTTPLLIYAVFSAALLKDIGRVLSQQRVILVDQSGEYLSDWNPLTGAMNGQSDYYKIYPLSTAYVRIEAEVTPLLARQLISKEGFAWLSSDLSVFTDWLAALLDQEGLGGKEITWALALPKREDLIEVLTTLDGASVEMIEPVATEHAEALYKWIKENIASGKISVNKSDSNVHIVKEGVFLDKKLFQNYADRVKLPMNLNIVLARFGNLMGIVKKGGQDYLHAQYFAQAESANTTSFGLAQHGREMKEGVVVRPDAIFVNTKMPESSSSLKTVNLRIPEDHKQPPAIINIVQKKSEPRA